MMVVVVLMVSAGDVEMVVVGEESLLCVCVGGGERRERVSLTCMFYLVMGYHYPLLRTPRLY